MLLAEWLLHLDETQVEEHAVDKKGAHLASGPPISHAKSLRLRWKRFAERGTNRLSFMNSKLRRVSATHVQMCYLFQRVGLEATAIEDSHPRHPILKTIKLIYIHGEGFLYSGGTLT